jgi:DNA-binding GntR family transcriptional regulator
LHDSIAAACGNRLLLREINRLKLLFRAFRDAAWRRYAVTRDHHRIVEEAREHLEIVEHLLADNAAQASRSMGRHINGGLRFWISAIPE